MLRENLNDLSIKQGSCTRSGQMWAWVRNYIGPHLMKLIISEWELPASYMVLYAQLSKMIWGLTYYLVHQSLSQFFFFFFLNWNRGKYPLFSVGKSENMWTQVSSCYDSSTINKADQREYNWSKREVWARDKEPCCLSQLFRLFTVTPFLLQVYLFLPINPPF